jgi:sulfur-oxidizing protein SoxY
MANPTSLKHKIGWGLLSLTLCSAAYGDNADPLQSPQWSLMHQRFLSNEPVVFDDKVQVTAPPSAEDSLNVPIAFKVQGLDKVEQVVVIADLNPIPQILRFYPVAISPSLAFRIKLQQGTPIHVAAKDDKGLWHVGGTWVDAAGGGCTLPSVGTSTGDWTKTLGKVSGQLWKRDDNNRLRVRIMHPMDTGLASGIPHFYIEQMTFSAPDGKVLARLETFEPISENPMLSLDIGQYSEVKMSGVDNNGNKIEARVQ